MTNPKHALLELADKGADLDIMRQMAQFMAQRLMAIDVEGRSLGSLAGVDPVFYLERRHSYEFR
jgi:putative transposase